MRLAEPRGRRRIVTLTPLIDVVFILLLFFMLASTFIQWRRIDLDLGGATAPEQRLEGAVLVRVHPEGLDINGRPVPLAELAETVRPQVDRRAAVPVIVQPDAGVALQRVVAVLDALAEGGARNISLQERGAGGP